VLFHVDSLTLLKVDNQHKTAVNYYFLSLQGVQAHLVAIDDSEQQ